MLTRLNHRSDRSGEGIQPIWDDPHHGLAQQEQNLGVAGAGDPCKLHADAEQAAGRHEVLLLGVQLLERTETERASGT